MSGVPRSIFFTSPGAGNSCAPPAGILKIFNQLGERESRLRSRHLPVFHASIFWHSGTAMLAKIYSAAVYGVDAYEIEIEVNGAGGDLNIVIVG